MNRDKLHCSASVNMILHRWLSLAKFYAKDFVNILFFDLYNIFKTGIIFTIL